MGKTYKVVRSSDYFTGGELIIPENYNGGKVTQIDAFAFEACEDITEVNIPSSVTAIGEGAFLRCNNLTNINIPNRVTSILRDTFEDCQSLQSINIPNSVTYIGEYAFTRSGLTSIVIPNSVTTLGACVFENCDSLEYMAIPKVFNPYFGEMFGAQGYEYSGYVPASLSTVAITGNITEIGENAFRDCSNIKHLTLPNGVTSIGNNAFSGCSGLENMQIPSTVTSVGVNVFNGCTFSTLEAPLSVFGSLSAADCATITTAVINNNNGITDLHRDTRVFAGANLERLVLPEGITTIRDEVFASRSKLKEIDLPESLTTIGRDTFIYCTSLAKIIIPSKVSSIDDYAFYGCTSLSEVTIPASVSTISNSAFEGCTSLSTIKYGGSQAQWLEKFSELPVNNAVVKFNDGSSLETAVYEVVFKNYNGTILQGPQYLRHGLLPNYEEVNPVRTSDVQYTYTFAGWEPEIAPITGNVTYVAQFTALPRQYTVTFKNWDGSQLASIEIAYGTTPSYNGATPTKDSDAQYDYIFAGWDKEIAAVTGNVTYTAQYNKTTKKYFVTFLGRTGNTIATQVVSYGSSAKAPTNPNTNDGYAFIGWNTSFDNITDNITVTGQYVKLNLTTTDNINYTISGAVDNSMIELILPARYGNGYIKGIDPFSFNMCNSLVSVTFPEGMTSIGSYAFAGRTSLTHIYIPDSMKFIGESAFEGCTNLTYVFYPGSVIDSTSIEIEDGNDVLLDATWTYSYGG